MLASHSTPIIVPIKDIVQWRNVAQSLVDVPAQCVPASAVWQAGHWPQPGISPPVVHCSAAANARAATERPEPGGPVNSQAWFMPSPAPVPSTMDCAAVAAAFNTETASGCPTTCAQITCSPPG